MIEQSNVLPVESYSFTVDPPWKRFTKPLGVLGLVVALSLIAVGSYGLYATNRSEQQALIEQENVVIEDDESALEEFLLEPEALPATASQKLVVEPTPTPSSKVVAKIVTPTPKAIPTPVPTPTPTPAPTVDINIEFSSPNRFGNNGCPAGETGYCELMSAEQMDFNYVIELRNNGSTPAKNLSVRAVIDGATQEQVVESIGNGGGAFVNFRLPGSVGNHSTTITVNPNKNPAETRYDNNTASFVYEVKPDRISPSARLDVINKPPTSKCFSPYVSDNVTQENDLALQLQVDGGSWSTITVRPDPSQEARYEFCISGVAGDVHQATLKVSDKRGNSSTATATMQF